MNKIWIGVGGLLIGILALMQLPNIFKFGQSIQNEAGADTHYVVPIANQGYDFLVGLLGLWIIPVLLGSVVCVLGIIYLFIIFGIMIYRRISRQKERNTKAK